jgi:Family of unknown function (DUF5317)
MTLVLLALAAGVVAGYARGGGLSRLATVRPQRNRLLLTALGLHALGVLGGWLWEPLLPTLVGLSWALLGYYAWVNRALHGATLVAAGLVANALVLLVNGAMPVSADAAVRAGADPAVLISAGQHELADDDTRLARLGKIVPVAFPPRPEVVTPGDVAVAAGLALAVAMGLTGRRSRARWSGRDDEWPDDADDGWADDPGAPDRDHDEADRHETMGVKAGR